MRHIGLMILGLMVFQIGICGELSDSILNTSNKSNFTTCDIASAYKNFYKEMGIKKPNEYFSCGEYDEKTKQELLTKYEYLDCQVAALEIHKFYSNPNSNFSANTKKFTCPPDYQITPDEKISAVWTELLPYVENKTYSFIAYNSSKIFYYISNSTKHKSDGVTSAWFFVVKTSKGNIPDNFTSEVQEIYYKCSEESMAIAQQIEYESFDAKGTVVSSIATPVAKLHFLEPVPNSYDELMLKTACESKPTSTIKQTKKKRDAKLM